MAFSEFRYHPKANAGLVALLGLGDEIFEELKRLINRVQYEWEPEDKDNALFIVPFHGFFLTFTVARKNKSILVLADVIPQPHI